MTKVALVYLAPVYGGEKSCFLFVLSQKLSFDSHEAHTLCLEPMLEAQVG